MRYFYDYTGVFLFERVIWTLIVLAVLVGLTVWYWATTRSIKQRLKASREHVARLEKVSDSLKHTVRDLEDKLQKQLASIEATITQLGGTVGEAQRETHDVEKHIDVLETKTEVAATAVDTIKHQVDMDVGELKRIDEQVKNSISRIDRNARHIDRLEIEVHTLLPGARPIRERHLD